MDATIGGGAMSPDEYARLTLRTCLQKRKAQLPATRAALEYAEACDAKLAELDEAEDFRAILDWSKATHAEFTALRA